VQVSGAQQQRTGIAYTPPCVTPTIRQAGPQTHDCGSCRPRTSAPHAKSSSSSPPAALQLPSSCSPAALQLPSSCPPASGHYGEQISTSGDYSHPPAGTAAPQRPQMDKKDRAQATHLVDLPIIHLLLPQPCARQRLRGGMI
jgi:hypothetical protein